MRGKEGTGHPVYGANAQPLGGSRDKPSTMGSWVPSSIVFQNCAKQRPHRGDSKRGGSEDMAAPMWIWNYEPPTSPPLGVPWCTATGHTRPFPSAASKEQETSTTKFLGLKMMMHEGQMRPHLGKMLRNRAEQQEAPTDGWLDLHSSP